MTKKIIIIGASAAGIGAAVKLKTLDKNAEIICITAEKEMPYNRCLLADYLAGHKTADDICTKGKDFFVSNSIALRCGDPVTDINAQEQSITCASGETHLYDALFLGIGRSSQRLPIPGYELPGVFAFYDQADAAAILKYISKNTIRHATVIGGGLSGIECADSLRQRGIEIDLIEREAHILPHQIDAQGAQFLANVMEKNGVFIHANQTVSMIDGKCNVQAIQRSDGTIIPTDMVIFATGGKTNLELAQKTGITCSRQGIITNDKMQTSIPTIFAGGDICMITDLATGNQIQSCLWTDAIMQGMVAAHNILGIEKSYPGALIVTSSNIFDTTFVTAGPVAQIPELYTVHQQSDGNSYHSYITDENHHLKGFVMVGAIGNVGALRKALLSKEPFELPQPQPCQTPNL